ncbi:MAG: hypothetical protein PHP01_00610 [Phycisphaerae bacterium]|nr:hypothetical protein [Phycisphaerae bacterium]
MTENLTNSQIPRYMNIYSNDMQFMAADASYWEDIEEGGTLLGLWSHGGNPVIMLATPSGPGAINENSHFAQDPGHVFEICRQLQEGFGIQCLGSWHSHHGLGLDCPSPGDVEQVHRFAKRSNIQKMVQIIVSYDRAGMFLHTRRKSIAESLLDKIRETKKSEPQKNMAEEDYRLIRIKAFFYPDAQNGSYQEYPINVLSGKNPIRSALAESQILHTPYPLDIGRFPLERTLFDKAIFPKWNENTQEQIPDFIIEQLANLDADIAKDAEICLDDKNITVSIPIRGDSILVVTYGIDDTEAPIDSINIRRGKDRKAIDITKTILADLDDLPLCVIYRKVSALAGFCTPRPLFTLCPTVTVIESEKEDDTAHTFSVKPEISNGEKEIQGGSEDALE